MKDRIDTQRPRMTGGERQRVWERVRQQTTSAGGHGAGDSAVDAAGRSESPFSRWFTGRRILTPMAVGAMATVVFAVVIWDRAAEQEADLDRIQSQSINGQVDGRADSRLTRQGPRRLTPEEKSRLQNVPYMAARSREGTEPLKETGNLGVSVDSKAASRSVVQSTGVLPEGERADVGVRSESDTAADSEDAGRIQVRADANDSSRPEPLPEVSSEANPEEEVDLGRAANADGEERQFKTTEQGLSLAKKKRIPGESKPKAKDDDGETYWGAVKGIYPTESDAPRSTAKTDATRDLKAGALNKESDAHFRGGRAGSTQPSEGGRRALGEDKRDPRADDEMAEALILAERSTTVTRAQTEAQPQAPPPPPSAELRDRLESNEPYDLVIYQDYGSNPLTFADTDPFSTFAVDVDNGSYTVARRYVTDGYLPEPASVRVEEFVNFFDPGYPEFQGPDFRIFVDGAEAPYGDGFHLLRVGLKARTVPDAERKPANLTFVVDISGSMSREDRLGLVRTSLEQLVDGLRPSDRVSLVVYGSRAEVLLRGTQVAKKDRILESIGRLQSAGRTNAEDGLRLGYEMAREMFDPEANNRIILCSDGVANVGRTGPDAILEVVRSEADKGVYLTTVGFGMGNYNDVLMEQLADQGDGAYYYVDRLDEADRIFRRELTGTLEVVGQDAKIQVEFDLRKVDGYRLIGFENRDVADRDFRNDDIDAGEIGSGHTVVALYEVRLQGDVHVDDTLATVRFRYAKPTTQAGERTQVTELEENVRAQQLLRSAETQSPRLQLAAVVAEYAEILRHSFWAQNRDLRDLVPVANELAGRLNDDPDVTEFSRLVWKAAEIQDRMTAEEKARRWPHLRADLPGYPDRW